MRYARLALCLLVATPLFAQQPIFRGATVTQVQSAGDIGAQIAQIARTERDAWIGYSVALPAGRTISICCNSGWNDECGSCSLEEDEHGININSSGEHKGTSSAAIVYRVRNGAVDNIRVFAGDATVSAAGARIHWLNGVDEKSSAAYLASFGRTSTETRPAKRALFALTLHPSGVDPLIDLARNASSSKVRSTALFWLSQTAGQKAAATLRDAAENDPNDDVKGKAVFGISQLPDDRSIPLLSELLRTSKSRTVRKKAAFWLGQKKDPRALEAIESFLRQ